MITFTGMVVVFIAEFVVLYHDLSLASNIPSWVFFYCAGSLLVYQALDAFDGMHARNIKIGSPLGQLFDAGIDAPLHGFLIMMQFEALKNGSSFVAFFYFISLVASFYTSHWQMYYSGVKYTGYGAFGLTEAQFLCIICFVITGIFGQGFWTPILQTPVTLISSTTGTFMTLFAGYKVMIQPIKVPVWRRFREVLPLMQYLILAYIWTLTSFHQKYPALVYFALSMVFHLQNGKLVLASVTHTIMPIFHIELFYLLLPSILLALELTGFMGKEMGVNLQFYCGILVLLLTIERATTYSILCVNQITRYLGFGFFDIPKVKVVTPMHIDRFYKEAGPSEFGH